MSPSDLHDLPRAWPFVRPFWSVSTAFGKFCVSLVSYFHSVYNDYLHDIVEGMYSKANINSCIPPTIQYIEVQFDSTVKQLHRDNEPSLNDESRAWINRTGRQLNQAVAYNSELVSPIERAHRTLR